MSKTILRPDDMKAGQYVTMLQGMFYENDEMSGNMFFGGGRTAGEEEKRFNGMILKIIAIDLPYVVVIDVEGNAKHFDLREGWIFKALSKEYVKSYSEGMKKRAGGR